MQESFQYILDHYLEHNGRATKADPSYKVLCVDLKHEIESFLSSYGDLKVKGSIGNGNRALCPWLAVMNRKIGTSTTHGLYIVYLFCSDMKGFYLSLNQGITYFARQYKNKKYIYAEKVAQYFQKEIPSSPFSADPISLGSSRGELGYGYEKTNIISKHYSSHNFSDNELKRDLEKMMEIYSYLLSYFPSFSYEKIVEDILNYISLNGDEDRKKRFLVKGEEAEKILKDVLEEKNAFDDLELQLEEVEPRCEISHHLKALDLEKTIHKKVDYIAQASKNAEDGARGEALALEYERKRLANIGLSDYIDKISWVSVESDSFGYDIASYDLIDGKVKKIQIEVKTTSSKIDREFFVSKAEVETSKRLSNTYYIYRIYHLYSLHPKIYRVRGALTDNFEIDPISYVAYYRGPASIALRK